MAEAPPDFTDRKAAEAWLRVQPRAVCAAIAARMALLVLPLIRLPHAPRYGDDADSAVASHTLPLFRAAAVAWLGAATRDAAADPELVAAARAAARMPHRVTEWVQAAGMAATHAGASLDAVSSRVHHAAEAAVAAVRAADPDIDAAASAWQAIFSASSAYAANEGAVLRHKPYRRRFLAGAAPAGRAPTAEGWTRPLWDGATPGWALKAWSDLRRDMLTSNEGWEVWIDWYEARLEGLAVARDVERARILLPDHLWKEGPKAVNAQIASLTAQRRRDAHGRLQARIAELEALLARGATGAAPPIGHNNPPEPIDSLAAQIAADLAILRDQPPAPGDPAPALAAARRLKGALLAATGWTAAKLDLFLTEAVREAGKQTGGWAVRLGALGFAGWMLDMLVGLAEIVQAARVWLATLGAGL